LSEPLFPGPAIATAAKSNESAKVPKVIFDFIMRDYFLFSLITWERMVFLAPTEES
jgi:hypothetical protein